MRTRFSTPCRLAAALLCGAAISCSDSHDDDSGGAASRTGGASGTGANQPGVTDPGGYVIRPGTTPLFPGSGTSDAGDPLPNGMVCDSVPGLPTPVIEEIAECYYDKNDRTKLAATLEQVLECVEEGSAIHVRLTFHPWFVDNTYGENAIGWDARAAMMPVMDPMKPPMLDPMGMVKMPKPKMGKAGHTFKDLVGSDHAEIMVKDQTGKVVLQFKLDYISEDASRPSGYGSLGVKGGEGKVIIGDADAVLRWMTSIDLNLNERGYSSYTVDSPATDDKFSPNPATPEWDYRVVYEAWIDIRIFGAVGFEGATIEFVHASPSKAQSNTIEVEPDDCPCEEANDPDRRCDDTPPPDGGTTDPCLDNDPDTLCGDSGVPPPPPDEGDPFCKEHPEDPACQVD